MDNYRTSRIDSTFPVNKKILLIFAKHPFPGKVKTRFSPPLSPEAASSIYEAMLSDLSETFRKPLDLKVKVCFYPADSIDYFKSKFFFADLEAQTGNSLGDRLLNAFESSFNSGAESVIAIGSDMPDISSELIDSAFESLDGKRGRVVIGPAEDGGYYLIGMNSFYPSLFKGISWSSSAVFEETAIKLKELRVGHSFLQLKSDLDTIDDILSYRPESGNGMHTFEEIRRVLKL